VTGRAGAGHAHIQPAQPAQLARHLSPTTRAPTASPLPTKTLSIGDVMDALRQDYPDVTLSKIRYLEAEGLVEPARTSSNYRKYGPTDVARLRYVLAAQRDRYLPLRVIKEELAELDRGGEPGRPRPRGVPDLPGPAGPGATGPGPAPAAGGPSAAADEVRLSRRDLLLATRLTEQQLVELQQFGLVRPQPGGTYFDGTALAVATVVAQLRRYGIEPRHLRPYKAAADREVGLIEQVVVPMRRQRDPQAAARADEARRELAALSLALHSALVQAGLRAGEFG
jgi:DNA-binding transcriptional MerR regulator